MNKFKEKLMPEDMIIKFNSLTPMEKTYFSIMWAKYGVLNISSKPGIAKSAISRSIANKMSFEYRDIRLTMVDETDVGLYPSVSEVDVNGELIKCLDFVVPRWAIEANKKPTIIHFEELNRASQQVRNAALQILLERQIGEFKFNDNVLMMSSGNLGAEDNTDVEEFDAALNNRLIHIEHNLSVVDWVDNFATENVHPLITQFISLYPEYLSKVKDGDKAYATPRSWTMLSEFIICNYGFDSTADIFLDSLRKVAHGYVGNSSIKFLQYCDQMLAISIQDVINDYGRIKKDLQRYNRDKNTELLFNLREINLDTLNSKQISNVIQFIETVSDDEKTGYFIHIIDTVADIESPNYEKLLMSFLPLLKEIRSINKVKE